MRWTTWASVAAAGAVLVGGTAFPDVRPALADNLWGANYFPNVALTTQDGATVRLYDDLLKGKSVAVNVMYTSCKDECPLETARLVQVQRLLGERMGKDIFFYSISIDPKRDTPEVLKAYAQKFGVGPGWVFLTGKEDDIKLVTKKLGLSRPSDAANRDGHLPILMIGDEPTGRWMKNSAVDSPKVLATRIGNFMGWQNPQPGRSSTDVAQLRAPDPGTYVFQSRCGACHSIGKGDSVGPDLAGVTTRRDRDWLVRYLRAPDQMLAEKDPIATALSARYKNVPMPNLRLSEGEIGVLLGFLREQSGAAQSAPPPSADQGLAVGQDHY
jgi:protein SCO1